LDGGFGLKAKVFRATAIPIRDMNRTMGKFLLFNIWENNLDIVQK
jgi:hypothetical protein